MVAPAKLFITVKAPNVVFDRMPLPSELITPKLDTAAAEVGQHADAVGPAGDRAAIDQRDIIGTYSENHAVAGETDDRSLVFRLWRSYRSRRRHLRRQ